MTVQSGQLGQGGRWFDAMRSPAAQWVGEIADADGIDPRTIRSAGLVQSMHQAVQDGWGNPALQVPVPWMPPPSLSYPCRCRWPMSGLGEGWMSLALAGGAI